MAKIIPAILTENLEDLRAKLRKIEKLSDWVQIDIMDGKFVPNKSVSLKVLKKIKISSNVEFHLMVENPENYFADCQKLKAKRVVWHIEGTKKPDLVLAEMGKYNFQKGVAINPATPVKKIRPYLGKIDLVLLLGVVPGFQGQRFRPSVLKKIKELRKIAPRVKIGLDGGVNIKNIRKIAKARLDTLVVGSYLVKVKNTRKNFQLLQKALQK